MKLLWIGWYRKVTLYHVRSHDDFSTAARKGASCDKVVQTPIVATIVDPVTTVLGPGTMQGTMLEDRSSIVRG